MLIVDCNGGFPAVGEHEFLLVLQYFGITDAISGTDWNHLGFVNKNSPKR